MSIRSPPRPRVGERRKEERHSCASIVASLMSFVCGLQISAHASQCRSLLGAALGHGFRVAAGM